MLRDVFYYGKKPNVHPRERFAKDLNDAKSQCTTEHFWIINEFCDYKGFDWDFDFEFLPDEDVWAEEHNNVWPSVYQKDSGTWLCANNDSEVIIYRADVDPLQRKNVPHDCWVELDLIDATNFDYGWHPDPTEPPYIYVWGSKWIPAEYKHVLEYHTPGATQYKYMQSVVELLPEWDKWTINYPVDKELFDFTWRPEDTETPYVYVFGNTLYPGEIMPTVTYTVPGATQVKYVSSIVAKLASNKENWTIPTGIDENQFDFSWMPSPTEPPFIYQFGTQHQKTGGPRYTVPGATEVKYIDTIKAVAIADMSKWQIADVVIESFDYSWHPDSTEDPYIYVFGNNLYPPEIMPTLRYVSEGATEIKFIKDIVAKLGQDTRNWITADIAISEFDYSWRPNPTEPPYIYVFGNQWFDSVTEPTVKYVVPGATEFKYMDNIVATVAPTVENWTTLIDVEDFDYSWRPHPDSPPYIYVWGNQWNNCFIEPSVVYTVPGATEYKYIEDSVAKAKKTEQHWETILPVSHFDFSWRPDPTEPPFIYVFGNKWNDAETEPTVLYRVPGATEYKFVDVIVATPEVNYTNWTIRNNKDKQVFDFSWRPSPKAPPAIYKWGDDGPIYTVPDAKEVVNVEYDVSIREQVVINVTAEEVVAKIINRAMFFVDRGNKESTERYAILKERFPQLQKTRYLNSWVETITRCTTKSDTELFWVLNSELDYTEFKFDYNPNPWQMKMVHVFGSQWTHWGNTYLVNKNTFNEDTKYVKVIEHLSMLNFVKDKRAKATDCLYDVILVNHGNESETETVIKSKINNKQIIPVDYKHSYLRTFKDALSKLESKKEHYVWICSSICDYTEFDFSYVCDPFAKDQLHVFPSDKQKFGDTFLVDVNKFRTLVDDMLMLEDYEKVNYNQHQRVKRLPAPTYINEKDTNVSITDFNFNWPYITIQSSDNKEITIVDNEPMSLWTPDSKNIIIHSTGGTCITVPKEAKDYVERELYDYPYISRSSKLVKSKPLDIVFLSNGETGADENYEHLLNVTRGLPNRIVRVDGVNGRVAAYHAAAEASETPWMFTVFAKLRVDKDFDWSWQPDRLQVPKHYIFNASNPVNNLVYGHQAMIAYNKRITLANTGRGLDFTLDDEHEVVDMNSGVAMYNTDEWSTWRTSFREALKLKATVVNNPDDKVSVERLLAWSTIGNNEYGQYSVDGALDAIEYYDSVNGDMDKLRLSYDWPWLRKYFESKYK